jgi:uncharacterized protein (TIGR02246 family)
MVIPLAFLLCLIVGCQQGVEVVEQPVPDVEADVQAIKDFTRNAVAAINAGDVDTIMSLYADDAIRIPPNEPATVGREAILSRVQKVFDDFTLQERDVVEDIKVSGDLAVAHSVYTATAMPKAGGEPIKLNGNAIWIFRKQPDDEWKVIYSIWSDESLVSPIQTE